ncbi:hypothetical protein GGS26DRAFT_586787 [Hypomontagnella submonticulosa]|nr:hypothetical protein GGS26DRAFT_586787 [Hypomontagnella submonticulosa]
MAERMPTAVERTPEELWLQIFQLLGAPSDIEVLYEPSDISTSSATLSTVSLCSKKFCRIARSVLYDTVYVYNTFKLFHLIRTLCEQPDLGELIRKVQMRSEFIRERTCSFPGDIGLDMLQTAFQKAKWALTLTPERRKDISYALGVRDAGHKMEFALAFMPNLEELSLSIPMRWIYRHHPTTIFELATQETGRIANDEPFYGYWLPADPPAVPPLSVDHFSRLRRVLLRHDTQELPIVQERLMSTVLRLPSLTSFSCYISTWKPETLNSSPTTLDFRYLNLNTTFIRGKELACLLSRCPKLTTLKLVLIDEKITRFVDTMQHYAVEWPYMELEATEGGRLTEIGDALRENAPPGLESLTLTFGSREWQYADRYRTGVTGHRFGSLRSLTNLKSLYVCLDELVGLQVYNHGNVPVPINLDHELPESLESLDIKACGRCLHSPANVYLHNQVMNIITNKMRTNLSEIRVGDIGNAEATVYYTRNAGWPGWRATWSNPMFDLTKLLHHRPEMLEMSAPLRQTDQSPPSDSDCWWCPRLEDRFNDVLMYV